MMTFIIQNKVAIVTGGISGIGLEHVKHILKEKAKGVVIADINAHEVEKLTNELKQKFGMDRVLFVKTDVSSYDSFENAFKKTIETFGNVDILINNAGIATEDKWENEIDINLKGTVNGMILGLDKYLRNNKQSEEAVIVNTGSTVIFQSVPTMPIYVATKFGVYGLTKSWGSSYHFERTNVRVVAVCPGVTETPLQKKTTKISSEYEKSRATDVSATIQSAEFVAKETMEIIKKASNGSVWIVEDFEPSYEYSMPDKSNFKNNILK